MMYCASSLTARPGGYYDTKDSKRLTIAQTGEAGGLFNPMQAT
jgi:hypothetical protein